MSNYAKESFFMKRKVMLSCKKALSAFLAVVMALSAFAVIGNVSINSITAEAASVKAASVTMGDVGFYVPEQIYLTPNALASTGSYVGYFSLYVNNTNSGGTTASRSDTTGYIYWSYAKATSATLSYRFMNSSFTTLSGGS